MSVIENFAALSAQEQREFAVALLKTINSESLFSSETNFELTKVEADDFTGGLTIEVSHTKPIEVSRPATWYCAEEEDASVDPKYDATYENDVYEDAKKAFKTTSTELDGYKVSLEIADINELENTEIDVDSTSQEDDGIGSYEHFGFIGYDSRPYIQVEGTIVTACDCALAFFVEPADEPVETTPEEPEEN
jgi:hypothetical protein